MPPPRVVGMNGQVAMVESNGQTLPVAWQQVNDPQLSAMVADYQASQQMPEPEMYADNTRQNPFAMPSIGQDPGALIDAAARTDATVPPPPSMSHTNPPLQNSAQSQSPRRAAARVAYQAPPTPQQPAAPNNNMQARLITPQMPPRPAQGARRPAQRPQQPARPMTDDEFIASVDQRRSRPGGPNSPRQAPTVADTAQREIANMRGLSDGQRELLSAQLAPLSAAEDTVRAQQQAETEQRNAVAGLGVSRMIDQEESRMRRQEREDRDRKFEETYAKERADLSADSFWKDKGVGMQVLAAISAGLGAMGASLNGGPNYALEIINGAIDRDIALKREAIGTKEDNLKRERTRFEDDEQWALAERMRGYEVAEQQIEMLGAGARTAQQRQAAVELQSQMRGLVAQTREQVRIDNARRAAAMAKAQRDALERRYAIPLPNGTQVDVRASDTRTLLDVAKLTREAAGEQAPQVPASLRPNGRGEVRLNDVIARQLAAEAAKTEAALAAIDRLDQLRDAVGADGEHFDSARLAEIQTATTELLAAQNNSLGFGALDVGGKETVMSQIPSVQSMSVSGLLPGGRDAVKAQLQELRRLTIDRANAATSQYNLDFVPRSEQAQQETDQGNARALELFAGGAR